MQLMYLIEDGENILISTTIGTLPGLNPPTSQAEFYHNSSSITQAELECKYDSKLVML